MCRTAANYISVWYDDPILLHGMYWRMVGGDSSKGKIAQLDRNGNEIQRITIRECATVTFNTGHRVYLTNSNGRTCYITVFPPLPTPLEIQNFLLSVNDTGKGSGLARLSFTIVGDGSKTLEINWGGLEISKSTKSAGDYVFARVMPSGTHKVCAGLL